MQVDKNTEVYIFLGTTEERDIFFFYHLLDSPSRVPNPDPKIAEGQKFKDMISMQVFNFLIHKKFVIRPSQKAIIYEIGKQSYINLIHAAGGPKLIFEPSELNDTFVQFLRTSRDSLYQITYDYDANCYYDVEIKMPPQLAQTFGKMATAYEGSAEKITKVKQWISKKEIK